MWWLTIKIYIKQNWCITYLLKDYHCRVLINYNNFLLILLPCVIFTDLKIHGSKCHNAWTDEYFLNNKVVSIERLIQGCIFLKAGRKLLFFWIFYFILEQRVNRFLLQHLYIRWTQTYFVHLGLFCIWQSVESPGFSLFTEGSENATPWDCVVFSILFSLFLVPFYWLG